MAARATRSASRRTRVTEAVASGPLGALSHDELGVIFDGLADPLQPAVAVALSSTCLGLRTPLRAALELLAQRHTAAKGLCRTAFLIRTNSDECAPTTCASMRVAKDLFWFGTSFTAADLSTLGMILRTNGLPSLTGLFVCDVGAGTMVMQTLCEGLRLGGATSLKELGLQVNAIGPAGAEALAAALRGGALPKLERLMLYSNPIGSRGFAALAVPLRKLSALKELHLSQTELDDEGLASLFGNLGKDDFKALESICLSSSENTRGHNKLGGKGYATLISVLDGEAMPKLERLVLSANCAWQAGLRQAAIRRHVELVFAPPM